MYCRLTIAECRMRKQLAGSRLAAKGQISWPSAVSNQRSAVSKNGDGLGKSFFCSRPISFRRRLGLANTYSAFLAETIIGLKVQVLYSSSSGNACHVFNEQGSILVDCGVSLAKLFQSGRFGIDAIFVTHEHHDHIQGVGALGRATGAKIFIHPASYDVLLSRNHRFFKGCSIATIEEGESIAVDSLMVKAHKTSHDAAAGLYYTFLDETNSAKYGMLTDTGMYLPAMAKVLSDCDALLLETNYDKELLEQYPEYPDAHKERIRSRRGHLSIDQTISFIRKHIDLDKMQWITFGHLSPRTNDPDIVFRRMKSVFPYYQSFSISPSSEHYVDR